MSAFDNWFETYERDGGELMLYNTIDLEVAFKAGMLRAAEIAEEMDNSEWNGAYQQYNIHNVIRKEAGND